MAIVHLNKDNHVRNKERSGCMDAFLQESHKPYILLTHPGQLLQPQAQLRGDENISVTRSRLLIIVPRLLFFFFF